MRCQLRRAIRPLNLYATWGVALLVALGADVNGQEIEIGIIDFYGLQGVPASQVREILTFREGDTVTLGNAKPAFLRESEDRLGRSPNIVRVLNRTACRREREGSGKAST